MNFEEFATKCCDYINELYEDVKVSVINVTKNNGLVLTGLQFKREKENIAPTIYLDNYYQDYDNGSNFYKVCDDIMKSYEDCKPCEVPDLNFFEKYDSVRGRIYCRVINRDKNEELLKTTPYVECMDLAIVFYIKISIGDRAGSVLVKNDHLDIWKVKLGIVYQDAIQNTISKMKTCVHSIEDVIFELIKNRAESDIVEISRILDAERENGGRSMMYVITNEDKYFGAACILDEKFLAEFSDKLGNDLFILPSSIHELIVVPDNGKISPCELGDMVKEINMTQVSRDEVLSDSIYRFCRDIGKVVPVEN